MTAHSRDPGTRRRARLLMALATALVLAGVVGYFVVVVRFGAQLPWLVADALPNQVLAVAGAGVAVLAARRGGLGVRAAAAANLVLAVGFLWMLHGMSAVSPVAGPPVGSPVPDFALRAPDGRLVRLTDHRGDPLLLVFYRGHW